MRWKLFYMATFWMCSHTFFVSTTSLGKPETYLEPNLNPNRNHNPNTNLMLTYSNTNLSNTNNLTLT